MGDERTGKRVFAPSSIPMTLSGGGVTLPMRSQVQLTDEDGLVVKPDSAEAEYFARQGRTCGECAKFDNSEAAQAKIRGEQFYQRLVREEGWKLKHLGSAPETHGLCGESNGEMLTGAMHSAKDCPGFRPRNGLVKISAKAR